MSTKYKKRQIHRLTVSGIEIEVTRKAIKNLYVKVSKRSGRVRISCPNRVSEQELVRFVLSRLDWIKKKKLEAQKVKQPEEYNFISGEEHYFKGKGYELTVIEGKGKSGAEIDGNSILLKVKPDSSKEKKEKVLDTFYRAELKSVIPNLIEKWEPVMKVKVKEFGVKKMRTRWGTCNIKARRIWLSLELAKKSPGCLEAVVVHEMVHLLERRHNARFYGLMDKFFPEWRKFEGELKSVID